MLLRTRNKCIIVHTDSDQQKILSRAESILERSFETVQECNGLIDRCKNDVERLKEERKKLLERVKEIDEDLIKVCIDMNCCAGASDHPAWHDSLKLPINSNWVRVVDLTGVIWCVI